MNDEADPFFSAMEAAGWALDAATNGFTKGEHWVSVQMAYAAWLKAERGEEVSEDEWAALAEKGRRRAEFRERFMNGH